MISEVKTLYKSNARDVPVMLRTLADEIERHAKENLPVPTCAVCVIFDPVTGQYNAYGWGDTDLFKSIAYLQVAAHGLTRIANGGRLWDVPVGGVK